MLAGRSADQGTAQSADFGADMRTEGPHRRRDRRRQRHRSRDRTPPGGGRLRGRHFRSRWRGRREGRGRDRGRRWPGEPAGCRYHGLRRGRARRRRCRVLLRAGLVPGQQCRMGSRGELPRHHARFLAQGRRHQSVRAAEHEPRRLRGMASRGFGRVVNIASDAGRVGSSGEAVYAACKGGIIAFTKTLAREPRRQGRDPQHDLPRPDRYRHPAQLPGRPGRHPHRRRPQARHSNAALGVPEDHPGLVAFLLSDDAAYITGQTISVSGGLTMHG